LKAGNVFFTRINKAQGFWDQTYDKLLAGEEEFRHTKA